MAGPTVDGDQLRALRVLRRHFGDVEVLAVVASPPLLAAGVQGDLLGNGSAAETRGAVPTTVQSGRRPSAEE